MNREIGHRFSHQRISFFMSSYRVLFVRISQNNKYNDMTNVILLETIICEKYIAIF